ncbi:uncharacterized protein LOC112082257 isoform X3 [Eutrema salsugineum]|uniref:uncharacterized protein LOC112082257 isoform X3 n=1 Tax=Eutrema salsugineum TaxID=72664 RepID=UPI000CED6172|nr:uncharacterized protein LOC112082257 isoform X3 [Eutrema salsugineum]
MSLAQKIQSAKVQSQAASIAQRRGNHGDAKVNFWKDPMNPGNWKDEQFMLIGSGLFCYGGYKFFNSDTVRETYRNEEARNLLLAAIFEK